MDIFNDAQLFSYMEDIARRVIDKSTEEILRDFKEDFVSKMAYVTGSPRKYLRTNEFKNAWRWSDIKKTANEISTKMFYDWTTMPTHDTDNLIHSGIGDWQGQDSRELLAEYLDVRMPKKPVGVKLFGNRTGRYWDEFISGYVESGRLKQVIDKHAKASGLEVSVSY